MEERGKENFWESLVGKSPVGSRPQCREGKNRSRKHVLRGWREQRFVKGPPSWGGGEEVQEVGVPRQGLRRERRGQ